MAEITAQMVKELRDSTGAPFIDCKKALEEVSGDLEKALDILKIRGSQRCILVVVFTSPT